MTTSRICWAVHDGRAGIRNQALGLAEAAARIADLRVEERILSRTGLPALLGSPRDPALRPPWPDLWIGCGRRSVAPGVAMRRRSQGRAFVVQLQNPRRDPARFDLVIAPEHDRLSGANVLSMLGAPNRVSAQTLAQAQTQFAAQLARLTGPRVAVLIGGASKRHSFDHVTLAALANALKALYAQGAGLMVTASRRTPAPAQALVDVLRDLPNVWIHDSARPDAGENPYFAFLGAADAVLATRDSVNMLTEAATAGKPVLTLPVTGADGKLAGLYRALEARGHARPFAGKLEIWDAPKLDETARMAREVVDRSSIL